MTLAKVDARATRTMGPAELCLAAVRAAEPRRVDNMIKEELEKSNERLCNGYASLCG